MHEARREYDSCAHCSFHLQLENNPEETQVCKAQRPEHMGRGVYCWCYYYPKASVITPRQILARNVTEDMLLKKHRCADHMGREVYCWRLGVIVLLLVLLPRGGYYIIEDMLLKKHRCAEHMGRGVYCWRYYFPEADISPICYCRPCYTRGYLKTMSSVDGRTNVQI